MSQQFELLAQKTIGDDVSGNFASNAGPNTKNGRFLGVAEFSDKFDIYVDQTDAQANWPAANVTNQIFVDAANDRIEAEFTKVGSNRATSFDLWQQGIFPSDTNWTLRWKHVMTVVGDTNSSASIGSVGLFNTDAFVTSASNHTFIIYRFFKGINQTTTNFIGLQSGVNITLNDGVGDIQFDQKNAVQTFYFELKRTSSTTYEATIYSDADYTDIIEKLKTTCSSSVVDLRYIKVQNDDRIVVGGQTFETEIDEVLFFNNTEGLQNFLTIKSDNLQTPDFLDSFDSYGSNITPTFEDDFSFAGLWVTSDSAQVDVEELEGFLFINSLSDNTNDQIARYLGQTQTVVPTFEDNFATDTWTQVGTNVAINPPVMDFDNPPNSSFEDSETVDMLGTTISDTQWVLRWKYSASTITQGSAGGLAFQDILFALSDEDSTSPVSNAQIFISFRHRVDVTQNVFEVFFAFFADMRQTLIPVKFETVPVTGTNYFFEMRRLTATTAECHIFSDAGYRLLVETVKFSFVSSVANLRYLKCMSWQGTGAFPQNDGQITGEIDDVKFWDGTNDVGDGASDTSWVLRTEVNLQDIQDGGTADDKRIYIGLFDQAELRTSSQPQDGIYIAFRTDNTKNDIYVSAVDGGIPTTEAELAIFSNPALDPITTKKYFLELKRLSATSVEAGFYTDNTYDNLIEKQIVTVPATIEDLQYVKVMNNRIAANGNIDGTLKNMEFWDNTIITRTPIADSYVQQGTDIVINKERSLIDFDGAVQNSLQMLTTDTVGASLGNVFSCRFKLIIKERVQGASSTAINLLIGLDQRDGTETLNQINTNFTGFRIRISSTVNEIRAISTSSSGGDDNPVTSTGTNKLFTTLPDPGTYYCEITKTADIFAIIKIWRDKDYTDIIEAIFSSSQPNGSMRFFKVANGNAGGTPDSTLIGTVDDIQVWNSVRDPDGYGMREYLHQSSLVKFASGTMQVADIVSGDNASNPGASKYISRHTLNGAADVTATASEGTMATGMVDSDVFIESFMNQEFKSVNSLALAANNVGLNIPDRMVSIWRYQEFPQLEKLTLINSLGGLYGTDSTSSVWGSIPT